MKKRAETKAKPQARRRRLDQLVGRDLDTLLALASSAIDLNLFMNRNVGYSDEWAIQIMASTDADMEAAREMASKLSWLQHWIRELKRNGPAFRALMGWQDRRLMANPCHHAEPRFGGDSVDGVVLPPDSDNHSERK